MESSKYHVRATDLFEEDFEIALTYYLEGVGVESATRFIGEYDHMRDLLVNLPEYGTLTSDTRFRWRPLGVFVALYSVDEEENMVTLMRLVYMNSDWKTRLLTE